MRRFVSAVIQLCYVACKDKVPLRPVGPAGKDVRPTLMSVARENPSQLGPPR